MFTAMFVLAIAVVALALDIADRNAARRNDRGFTVVIGRGNGLEGF